MAVQSTTNPEHRSAFVAALARRVLVTAGLTVAGAALTLAFGSVANAANADDSGTSSGTGQTTTTAAVTAESTATPASTAAPASATPASTAAPASTATPASTEAPATAEPETAAPEPEPVAPAQRVKKAKPAEPPVTSASALMATMAAEGEIPAAPKAPGGSLLGGLFNTVGGVLNAVTTTVGSVGDVVLKPIVTPIIRPIDHCPAPDAVVTLPELDSGFDAWPAPATAQSRGTTSTVAAPEVLAALKNVKQAVAEEPAPARVAPAVQQVTTVTAVAKAKSAPPPVAPEPDKTEANTRAGTGGGGSPGGGAPPSTPCAPPAGHSVSAHPGQDNNGGRGHLGVLPSSDSTTQLRLIGTSRDHAADGAGRDAALPTTSPD